jgi:hypothetical protein
MSFKLEDISFKIKEIPIDKEEKNDGINNWNFYVLLYFILYVRIVFIFL